MPVQEIVDALAAALPGARVLLGPEHLAAHASPPRIVVVPGRDRFSSPRHGRDAGGKVLPSVRTRTIGLDVHIWGIDYEDVEAMLDALILALDSLGRTSHEIVSGTWVDSQAAPWLQHGRAYVLLCTFDAPIVREPGIQAPVSAVNLGGF